MTDLDTVTMVDSVRRENVMSIEEYGFDQVLHIPTFKILNSN
jgi:hypothetical protein